MNIYLRHPIHGTKVAICDLEADYDEQNGWVRYDLGDVEPPVTVNEMRRPRGRPRVGAAELGA